MSLIQHALDGLCSDPDCELHNPEVGRAEGVVSDANMAFYIAGAAVMYDLVMASHDGADPYAEFLDQHAPEARP